ncbi:FxSxx-COOH system tetratricopeptide repeat protein [Nonomuraea africana]|uniref:FxSxx-COOH system tetratricopeptide repeat protein n=1 Tax=Nonomuraea africana TaxID=46171 RepID=UPI0033CD1A66
MTQQGERVTASDRGVAAGRDITGPVTTGDGSPIDARTARLEPGSLLAPGQVDVAAPIRFLQEPRAAEFVGREDALTALEQMLAGDGEQVVIRQLVRGMGGVGKSELVRHYAHAHQAGYPVAYWITADTVENIEKGFAALAAEIHPPIALVGDVREASQWALGWLRAHPGWLVVLDNVDDPAAVRPWLDHLAAGHVLITTRRDVHWPGTRVVSLDVLDERSSVELITKVGGCERPQDHADVAAIAAELGHLPLALEQAAAYIRQSHKSPGRYLARLRRHPARMYATSTAGGSAEQTMARLWDTHLEAIRERADLKAEHLLRTLACYAPDNVPRTLLIGDADDLDLDDALELLASYSMITREGEEQETVSMHRLFQSVIYNGLDYHDPRSHAARESALARLSQALPADPHSNVAGWPLWRDLLPHVNALVLRYRQGSEPEELGRVLNQAALFSSTQGRHQHARDFSSRALAIAEAALGPDHPDVATCLGNLASSLRDLGRASEAVPLFQRALAITEAALGPGHPDVAIRLGNLAVSFRDLGRVGEAVPLFERALAITEAALGPGHPYAAIWLGNLAASFTALGRAGEAVPLERRALAVTEAALGPDHPTVATLLGNLASSLHALGRAGGAVPLSERALAITEAALGPDHPDVAIRLGNLAASLRDLGRVGEAARLEERALAIAEAALGPDHPDVATCLGNLAVSLRVLGRAGEAVELERRALAISEAALGPDHPDMALRVGNLAVSLSDLGRTGEAVELERRALAIIEAALGPDHPTVAIRLGNLALSLHELGRAGEAVALFERALAITEAALGPDHPQAKTLRQSISHTLDGMCGCGSGKRFKHCHGRR